jgi:XTP/dITP diphosphohydrolase
MIIYLATNNAHKIAELEGILTGHILKTADFPYSAPEETGKSFAENALIKARSLYELVRAPVLADDSGLCVDALNGAPGIYSARYGSAGGAALSDTQRNSLLLSELGGTTQRSARFVCAMALLLSADRFFLVQETLEGCILDAPRGGCGFGYDPIVYLPSLKRTVAELSASEKNLLSHRAKAGRAIAALKLTVPS